MSQLAYQHDRPPAQSVAESVIEEIWFGVDDIDSAEDRAHESLSASVARISGLKTFPVVAQKVIEALDDPEFSVGEIERLFRSDAALALRLLRVANSPLFGFPKPCKDLTDAFMRLGADGVQELVIMAASRYLFDNKRGRKMALRDHCASVASLAHSLGEHRTFSEPHKLFLGGLLHDVGKFLFIQSGELEYRALGCGPTVAADRVHTKEQDAVGFHHGVLGARMLDEWKLPHAVVETVAWHHNPARAYQAGGDTALRVAVVRCANQLDYRLQRGEAWNEPAMSALCETADFAQAAVSVAELRESWEDLLEHRADTLRLFGKK